MLQFEMSSNITVSMKNGKIKGNKKFAEQLKQIMVLTNQAYLLR